MLLPRVVCLSEQSDWRWCSSSLQPHPSCVWRRPDALQVVVRLRGLGMRVMMLSGDNPASVAAMAAGAGIQVPPPAPAAACLHSIVCILGIGVLGLSHKLK